MKRIDIHPDHMIAKMMLQITGLTQQEDAEYTELVRDLITGSGIKGLLQQISQLAQNCSNQGGVIDDFALAGMMRTVAMLLALRLREVSQGKRTLGDTEILIALRTIWTVNPWPLSTCPLLPSRTGWPTSTQCEALPAA